jgi:predicted nucleic acid-binding protein
MSDRYFLDTNVFVYTFDDSSPRKKTRADDLVRDALETGRGLTSFQVVQEFLNVATRKFAVPLTTDDSRLFVDRVLDPLCEVHSSIDLYRDALEVRERWKFSFYDSLVVAAALSARCTTLYSEDLQSGQRVRELTIVDPFA